LESGYTIVIFPAAAVSPGSDSKPVTFIMSCENLLTVILYEVEKHGREKRVLLRVQVRRDD